MIKEKETEQEYGGLSTLSTKEKVQFLIAFSGVILALIAFTLKIYFF